MRIILFPSSYVPVTGGVQTVAHNLARGFNERGHEVRVLTNRYPVSLPKTEEIDGVAVERLLLLKPQVEQLRRERPDLFLASFYFYPKSHRRLRNLVASFRPDVINVHFPDSQIPFALALRRQFNFRLVASLHGYDVERWCASNGTSSGSVNSSSPRPQDLLKLFLKEADAVTACSENLLAKANQIERSISSKSHVVPNGVDLKNHTNTISHPHPRPYVLSYGRLTYNKGFDLLISAFADASRLFPEVDLIVAGEGEESERLKEQARSAGIADRVHFFGRADSKQIIELLNGCLFLIVPSRSESFGISALEGMAAGKAVLATKVGGLPELLDLSVNNLVDPTVDGLAAGIREWLGFPERVSVRGRQNRLTAVNYDWSRTVQGYLNAYKVFGEKAA